MKSTRQTSPLLLQTPAAQAPSVFQNQNPAFLTNKVKECIKSFHTNILTTNQRAKNMKYIALIGFCLTLTACQTLDYAKGRSQSIFTRESGQAGQRIGGG